MITFEHVTYTYPESATPALHDVSFHLPAGEVTLVIGPSGAGKSTLLRCINGLVPHFSGGVLEGTITVGDFNPVVATPNVMSRHVGFIFQDPEAQFVLDRVEDEIAFALENAALPRQAMHTRVAEVLDLLALTPLRDRRLETLSGGEKQRVAIAAALALRPRVMVLDEPTSQLDPQSAEDVLSTLARLNRALGLMVVLAEHRLERVLPFTHRIVAFTGNWRGRGPSPATLRVGLPREVLSYVERVPPVVALGKALGWSPLPLTVEEARHVLGLDQETFAQREDVEGGGRESEDKSRLSAQQQKPYIDVRGIDVGYEREGQAQVLQQVDFAVYPGEILALLGRNGVGKTTLLKSIVGLIRPQRGEIIVDGQTTADMDVVDVCRQVGYLPQDPNALLFADTVLDELRITLQNHGLDEKSAPVDPEGLLTRLGLADKAQRYPRDLSAGEQQRVALGAIMVTHPGALLLDEPTRGLDYVAKARLLAHLQGWRDEGMAIVLVTHDVELVAAAADRVALMRPGLEGIITGDPAVLLGQSPPGPTGSAFTPQIARLFPGTGWLTVEDALRRLHHAPQ
jgi:energy-coupling factor transport system ATP-binding protein